MNDPTVKQGHVHGELMISDNPGVSPDLAHDAVKFTDGQCFDDLPFADTHC